MLELRSSTQTRALSLLPSTREAVGMAIRASLPGRAQEDQTIRGLLRAMHLDQDWIEVTVDGESVHIKQVGEVVEDIIGPFVNLFVVAQVTRDVRGKLHFRYIERGK